MSVNRSSRPPQIVLFVTFAVFMSLNAQPSTAQQGGFIEDLFRSVAEAQLQREQRKRVEAETNARAPEPQAIDPRQVPVPPSVFPGGPLGPATPPSGREIDRPFPPNRNPPAGPSKTPTEARDPTKPGSITVRSREAADFVGNLVRFNAAITPLVEDMKRNSVKVPALRPLVPVGYRVNADTRALLGQCDGLAAPQTLVEPYCELDTRWRQLSFGLRSLDGLSSQCTGWVRECDQVCALMAKQLGVQPQFDREELRHVMLTAATYMQSLIDDLSLANLSPQDRDVLVRDVRLLRQHLLTESNHVNDSNYEEVVTRFTDFVSRWQKVSSRLAGMNDPHVRMRLERIGQCGTDTYALMWMPPPMPQIDVRAQVVGLQRSCTALLDQLSLRTLGKLPPPDQIRIVEMSRTLDDKCRQLARLSENRAAQRELAVSFSEVDETWVSLRRTLGTLATVDRQTLVAMDAACDGLRQIFGGSPRGSSLDYESLLSAAASLEGSTEYLQADIQRYERYFQPSSYRDAVVRSTTELHEASKQLHFELSRRADLATVQVPADAVVHAFDRLSHDLEDVERHGLTGSRAGVIQRAQRDLVPVVAQIGAALLDH